MTTQQPEALRLAHLLAIDKWPDAAAELRRLHAESELHQQELASYRFTVENRDARIAELEAQLAAAQQGVQPFCWFFIKSQLPGDYEFTRDGDRANEARKYGYKPVPLFTHPTTQGLDADMFWDADNPECCETSINNVVVEVDSYRGLKVGDTVTIQLAKSLPDLEVRVTQVPDTEGNGDLEWAEIVAAKAKQGGV